MLNFLLYFFVEMISHGRSSHFLVVLDMESLNSPDFREKFGSFSQTIGPVLVIVEKYQGFSFRLSV